MVDTSSSRTFSQGSFYPSSRSTNPADEKKKKTVELDLKPILSAADICTGVAVHGTTLAAWESICASRFLIKGKRAKFGIFE